MANFYCEYCGHKANSIANLTNNNCQRHPDGFAKGRHKLYEGSEKSHYSCKHCRTSANSIANLTNNNCQKHPDGFAKGRHAPTL